MQTKQQLIDFLGNRARRVHFVGIGGVGMSGLARLLLQQGHRVTGSDVAPNGLTDELWKRGATIHAGHAAANLPADTELVIYTTAVTEANPELAAARAAHMPCVRRGLLLAALMNHRYNIAVAGTHGKTTTAAMIAQILRQGDSLPTYCIGAHIPVLGSNAQLGAGKYFVAEACESDGTLIHFTPEIAVCLNVEAEHLDHYGTLNRLLDTFATLCRRTREAVVYCADCPRCVPLARQAGRAISFGLGDHADYRASEIVATSRGSRFTVWCRDKQLGVVELVIPGRQNVSNALAAIAVAEQLEIPFEKVVAALVEFTGAQRRFERKFDAGGIVVVDDYAHHPTEIRATIAAARTQGHQRILAAFQPHRYTRTQALLAEFATAFVGVDHLWLTDIYAASEPPIPGVTGTALFEAVRASEVQEGKIEYEADHKRLTERLVAAARPGDLILVMGAGNIYKVAAGVADRLRQRLPKMAEPTRNLAKDLKALLTDRSVVKTHEPMARHTSMRVGGPAELFVSPWDEAELVKLLRFCHARGVPVTPVGRGTNLLVCDGGIAGVVVQLGSAEFLQVKRDGNRILAGAGARLRAIVNEARKFNLGGLEFLEGIPGSLGGALRMNAGAMGRQTFEVVEWLRYVSMAGEIYDADAQTVPVSYRSCPLLTTHIALAAMLRGEPVARTEIDDRLRSYTQRRWATQPNQPSAGCVFKNPGAVSAGQLIDELGLKGTRVGGATVSEKHGNFIVNTGGATATDVLRLIATVRERVWRERGIKLELEVMIVGEEL